MNNDTVFFVADSDAPQCSSGKQQCRIIDQLSALRKEVVALTEQVRTDTLTGLFNYRHFIQALALEMERTRRTQQPTALIMVDLDHFKNINDTWGHDVGNKALITTASLFRQTTRQLDISCRYGGEEFAIILPSVDLIVATQVAERVRASIEMTPILNEGKDINLTASLGIALYDTFREETPEEFIARADHFLYQAKESGRNRICHEIIELENTHLAVSEEEKDALFTVFDSDNK